MPAKPWTKAQAKNNKKFEAKLDRITNYLVDGDWHGSFISKTFAEADGIINFVPTKSTLPLFTLEFSLIPGGALKAERTYETSFGEIVRENYIAGVQPFEGTFYMISLDDKDFVMGTINKKSGLISVTVLEPAQSGAEAFLGIEQYTNLSM